MPITIDHREVERLVRAERAQLVDVLPRADFEWAHLPGAIHFPLELFSRLAARERLEAGRPIIVYCSGSL